MVTELRKQETPLQVMMGTRIKMVERAGRSLKSMLFKVYPWGGPPCPREECQVCDSSEGDVICRTKNVVYTNICQICCETGQDARYIGETGRSVGERLTEHMQDAKDSKEGTHIHDHMEETHRGEAPRMKTKILSRCRTALQRQVSETVIIKMKKTDRKQDTK